MLKKGSYFLLVKFKNSRGWSSAHEIIFLKPLFNSLSKLSNKLVFQTPIIGCILFSDLARIIFKFGDILIYNLSIAHEVKKNNVDRISIILAKSLLGKE